MTIISLTGAIKMNDKMNGNGAIQSVTIISLTGAIKMNDKMNGNGARHLYRSDIYIACFAEIMA